MTPADLLLDAFGRIREVVRSTVDGLGPDELATRPDPRANSIGWMVWHLTRIQDDHVARAAARPQVYTAQDFASRFDLPFDDADTGYGHSSADVAAVRPKSADLLIAYHDAVHEQTARYVRGLGEEDLARIVDRSWNPPVTLGVRLISVISDDLQHAGQAAYVRGLLGA